MKCACTENYICTDCEEARAFRRLSVMDKVKLTQYKKYLNETKTPDREMFILMDYLLERDIDSSLARLL